MWPINATDKIQTHNLSDANLFIHIFIQVKRSHPLTHLGSSAQLALVVGYWTLYLMDNNHWLGQWLNWYAGLF